jgi:hypothetical protein
VATAEPIPPIAKNDGGRKSPRVATGETLGGAKGPFHSDLHGGRRGGVGWDLTDTFPVGGGVTTAGAAGRYAGVDASSGRWTSTPPRSSHYESESKSQKHPE